MPTDPSPRSWSPALSHAIAIPVIAVVMGVSPARARLRSPFYWRRPRDANSRRATICTRQPTSKKCAAARP